MTTRDQVLEGVVAAINAVLPADVRAYDSDDVPTPRPKTYIEVMVSRRFIDDERRADGSLSFTGFRIGTRCVARLSSNVRQAQTDVTAALDFVTLTFADGLSGVVEFETEDEPRPDDGWFSALTDWIVSL